MKSVGSVFRSGSVIGGVLLLAACSGGGGGGGSAAPSVSATAAPTPYGTTLDQALAPINAGLGKVAAAKTVTELGSALATVESDADRAARSLNATGTPAGAEAARTELVNGLNALSSEALSIRVELKDKKLCTVGVVQARLGAGQGLVAVPAALAKLATAGYQAAFTVPELPKPQPQPRSLENGAVVRDGGNSGKGTLKFNNNGSTDAVFMLAADGKAVASAYAVKGQVATIEGVKAGAYDIYYTSGVDWDSEAKQFTQSCQFVKVGDKHEFAPDGGGTIWTVKLRAEDGKGNAKAESQTVYSAPQP
ncbi:hypothetical protein GCM10018790_17690 [Kitasatospora xanthocidica]|uniref:hypothetical protein n=1 Tax=Kitasatospora xanthocidica TaxID=83382 RepID=UPI00167636BE|nr:hypothetical protein [Kitasatospora xanthocidica]GHF40546.1 hypothetical protein GCM10018790_17690 [Kitasatospora xanthocidica]